MKDEEGTGEQSIFDMSFSTLGRINYVFWQCNQASDIDDATAWFKACKNLYKESINEMKPTEKDKMKSEFKELEKNYGEYLTYMQGYQLAKQKGSRESFKPPRNVFDKLFEIEVELRRILAPLMLKKGEEIGTTMLR